MAPSEVGELVDDEDTLVSVVAGDIVPKEVVVEAKDLVEEGVVGVVDIPRY